MTRIKFVPSPALFSLVLKGHKFLNHEEDSKIYQDEAFLAALADTIDRAVLGLVGSMSSNLGRMKEEKSQMTSGGVLLPAIQDCFPARVCLLQSDKAEFGKLLGEELVAHLTLHGPVYRPPPNGQMRRLIVEDGEVVILATPEKPKLVGPYRRRATFGRFGEGKLEPQTGETE